MTKSQKYKGRRYIDWEEDEKYSSFSSSSNDDDDELVHLCLMALHREKDLEICDSDSHLKYLSKNLLNNFQKMHAKALNAFENLPSKEKGL